VNVHTHLELTGFEELTPDRPFREWILEIRRRKERRCGADFLEAARTGLRDCWAAGVTTVADTGDSGAALQALAGLGGSGIVYQEVFWAPPGAAGGELRRAGGESACPPVPVAGKAPARRLASRAVHRERAAVRPCRVVGPAGRAPPGGAHRGIVRGVRVRNLGDGTLRRGLEGKGNSPARPRPATSRPHPPHLPPCNGSTTTASSAPTPLHPRHSALSRGHRPPP
jgi:hypothetical protein